MTITIVVNNDTVNHEECILSVLLNHRFLHVYVTFLINDFYLSDPENIWNRWMWKSSFRLVYMRRNVCHIGKVGVYARFQSSFHFLLHTGNLTTISDIRSAK